MSADTQVNQPSTPSESTQQVAQPQTSEPPQPPPGMRYVKEEDWNARDSVYAKMHEAGITDPDTIAKYSSLHKAITQRGLDPMYLTNLLADPKPQQSQSSEPRYLTREEAEQLYAEREARTRAELEWETHQKSAPAKIEAKVGDYLKGLGLKPESKFSRFLRSAISEDIREARIAARDEDWWKSSPLASERLPPVTDALIEKVLQTQKYQDILTEMRGELLAAIGEGSGSPVRPTANATDKSEAQNGQVPKAKRMLDEDDDEFDDKAMRIVREVVSRRA